MATQPKWQLSGDYFETHEIDGKTIERPKRFADLPPEIRKNIEKITISSNGRLVPQLYSKLAAQAAQYRRAE